MTDVRLDGALGKLEARLRSLVPRLGRRDREIVLAGIQAIKDLALALHREEQRNAQTTVRFNEPMRISTRPDCPACGVPLSGEVGRNHQTYCPGCARTWHLNDALSVVREMRVDDARDWNGPKPLRGDTAR